MLILFATLSKAQTKVIPDSLQCFTPSETRKIAVTILKEKECAQLLNITNKQLSNRMEVIADQDAQLILLNKVSKDKDVIIENKSQQIKEHEKLLKREVRRKKFWKFCASGTAAVAGVIIVILAIR